MKKFNELTPRERAERCNGCGGKGGKIKPPHADLFKYECDHHDHRYHEGGGWLKRLRADWLLRRDMRAKIKTEPVESLRAHLYIDDSKFPDIAIRQVYYRWADAYMLGVMAAGWKFFNFK